MIQSILDKVTDGLLERGEPSPTVLSTGGSIANLTKDWAQKSRFVGDLTLIAWQRRRNVIILISLSIAKITLSFIIYKVFLFAFSPAPL